MSNFNKPHSFGSKIVGYKQKFRERQYPYILSKSRMISTLGTCEACKKTTEYSIHYYMNKESSEAVVFLCSDHEKLTRYGKWDQVFRDIDRKCEEGAT